MLPVTITVIYDEHGMGVGVTVDGGSLYTLERIM
jgi:hypothetical protein